MTEVEQLRTRVDVLETVLRMVIRELVSRPERNGIPACGTTIFGSLDGYQIGGGSDWVLGRHRDGVGLRTRPKRASSPPFSRSRGAWNRAH